MHDSYACTYERYRVCKIQDVLKKSFEMSVKRAGIFQDPSPKAGSFNYLYASNNTYVNACK